MGRGGGVQGLREAPRGCGRAGPGLLPAAAPGAEGRGPRGLIDSSAGAARSKPDPSSVAPARAHAAPPATASRATAGGPVPRRPAARAAPAAGPPGGGGGARGVRGARGLRVASGRGAPARAPVAGGARGAPLLQLPRELAQRPSSAG